MGMGHLEAAIDTYALIVKGVTLIGVAGAG